MDLMGPVVTVIHQHPLLPLRFALILALLAAACSATMLDTVACNSLASDALLSALGVGEEPADPLPPSSSVPPSSFPSSSSSFAPRSAPGVAVAASGTATASSGGLAEGPAFFPHIGSRVEVLFEGDKWFAGTVTHHLSPPPTPQWPAVPARVAILYDDGDKEECLFPDPANPGELRGHAAAPICVEVRLMQLHKRILDLQVQSHGALLARMTAAHARTTLMPLGTPAMLGTDAWGGGGAPTGAGAAAGGAGAWGGPDGADFGDQGLGTFGADMGTARQQSWAAQSSVPGGRSSRAHSFSSGWQPDEDARLQQLVQHNGAGKWNSVIAPRMGSRSGKQCRERWHNQLDPSIRKEPFTEQEDCLILESVNKLGPSWSAISKLLPPGRTDNAIKNRYNSTLARALGVGQLRKRPRSVTHTGGEASNATQRVQVAVQPQTQTHAEVRAAQSQQPLPQPPSAQEPQSSVAGQSGAAEAVDAGLCAQCGGRAEFRCSLCKVVHYCCRTCQTQHWASHRDSCKPPMSSA